jgi:hypothetical protein
LEGDLVKIRNRFSHFNMLQGSTPALDLTQEVNYARKLMAYDRKLKNAVSKSIIEMLAREGLKITWKTDTDHSLVLDKVDPEEITHLNDKHLMEAMHSQPYCQMVKHLFATASIPEHTLKN